MITMSYYYHAKDVHANNNTHIESGASIDRMRTVHIDLVVLNKEGSMNNNTLLRVFLSKDGSMNNKTLLRVVLYLIS